MFSCSDHLINVLTLATHAEDTAALDIRLYRWYYMPAKVHEIMIEGTFLNHYAKYE